MAIDTQQKLIVELSIKRHGRTQSLVQLNGFVVNVDDITFNIDLLDSVEIFADLLDFDEGTSGLEVFLTINGHEILPKYQHLSSNKKSYVDTKELWWYRIPSPFYTWYHEISGKGWIA
jgi:hypothetical protein